jgi:hypothetical protein
MKSQMEMVRARAPFARGVGLQAEQRWKRSETTIDR